MTKPLSPIAQAVLDAAIDADRKESMHPPYEAIAAAALRAAADQVVPEQTREPHGTGFRWGGWAGQQGARRDLLAIAAELENQMTDISPSVEVELSSDLFNDDPCLESMSASALSVLDAYMTGYGWLDSPTKSDCLGIAAALCAAAWAILPKDSPHIEDFPEDDDDSPSDRIRHLKKRIRNEFLAVANELKNQK